eukprot:504784-Hanusia_phi.AAC.1
MPRPGMAGLVLALMVSAGGVGGFMHAGRGWAPLTRPSRSSPYSPWGHAERFSGTLATLRCLRARKERGGILSCGASTADVSSMKVAEIKNELLRRGVSSQGLFEKEELVRALLKAREEQSSDLDSLDVVKDLGGLVVPMKRTRARENSLGSEVRVDEKDYFSVVVSFPALQGTAAEFVIDTASTLSIVVPSFAARTQAKGTGRMASVNAATAGGQQLKQVSLGRTEIAAGGRQVDCGTLEPIVMDLPVRDGVAGLLGVDFLLRFDALFDLKEERVVLAPPSTIVSGATRAPSALRAMERAGLVEVPMFFLPPPAGFYVVKVKIEVGGKSSPVMSAVVDMGSTFTVINSAAARAVGVEEGSPVFPAPPGHKFCALWSNIAGTEFLDDQVPRGLQLLPLSLYCFFPSLPSPSLLPPSHALSRSPVSALDAEAKNSWTLISKWEDLKE